MMTQTGGGDANFLAEGWTKDKNNPALFPLQGKARRAEFKKLFKK